MNLQTARMRFAELRSERDVTPADLDDVEPIVCYDDDGNLFSNNELSRGGASLWDIEFRGEVTATMVYDGQPVFDHFKKVDDDTLMGIMNGKRQRVSGHLLYFLLERA